jgi:UDP-galactopyranose mutase
MREYKGLSNELERSLITRLVKVHYGENSDALVEYVFEVLDYRKLTFEQIINELQDVRVCSVCGEATHIDFMADTEGQADTSDEQMCDWCMGNGQ